MFPLKTNPTNNRYSFKTIKISLNPQNFAKNLKKDTRDTWELNKIIGAHENIFSHSPRVKSNFYKLPKMFS